MPAPSPHHMPHVQRQTQGRHLCAVAPEDPLGQRQELVLFQLGVGGVLMS